MVYDVSRDALTHPQKLWICQKILCYFASLRQDGMIQLTCTNFVSYFFFFGGGGGRETGDYIIILIII